MSDTGAVISGTQLADASRQAADAMDRFTLACHVPLGNSGRCPICKCNAPCPMSVDVRRRLDERVARTALRP